MSRRAHSVNDAFFYVAKVWAAGIAAAVLVPLALLAAFLDVLDSNGRLVTRVLTASARLEAAIDVHGSLTRIEVIEADGQRETVNRTEPVHAADRPSSGLTLAT